MHNKTEDYSKAGGGQYCKSCGHMQAWQSLLEVILSWGYSKTYTKKNCKNGWICPQPAVMPTNTNPH